MCWRVDRGIICGKIHAKYFKSIQFGQIGIGFYCNWPEDDRSLVASLKILKELSPSEKVRDRLALIFVPAETAEETAEYLRSLPEEVRPLVELGRRAWAEATAYDGASGGNGGSYLLRDWRELLAQLEIIVPQLGVYRWKESLNNIFLRFLPQYTKTDNRGRKIIETICSLGLYWYGLHGGLACLHASAVLRNGKAFVFLGPSEAGKSTAALLGIEAGGKIIDDDMVSLAREGEEDYAVFSTRVWGEWLQKPCLPVPKFVEVGAGAPLAGIFVLNQAGEDRLTPLSKPEASDVLARQTLGQDIGMRLPMSKATMRKISENCCTIAERVPAYRLHFRKSPDFWKLIDDALGK